MVRGDCLFSATGVTTGSMLAGVQFSGEIIETDTVVMRSVTETSAGSEPSTGNMTSFSSQHDKFQLD